MLRAVAAVLLFCLIACGILKAGKRPKYVGPIARPLWKVEDLMVDQVFIEDGVVYCRARTFSKPVHHLYAFDTTNGRQLWISSFVPDTGLRHFFAGKLLVVPDSEKAIHILDAKTGSPIERNPFGNAQSGVTVDGVTYVVSDGRRLSAFDTKLLRELWHTGSGGEVADGPVVAGSKVYVVSGATVQALDSKTGAAQWKADVPGYRSAIAADETAAYLYWTRDATVVAALDASTGKLRWSQPITSTNTTESPILVRSGQLLVRDNPPGKDARKSESGYVLRTLKRDTGEKVAEAVTAWKYPRWVTADGHIYASDKESGPLLNEGGDAPVDSWLTVVNLATGKELWRSETVHWGVFTQPAVGSGVVAVGVAPYAPPVPKPDDPMPAGLLVWKVGL